MNETDGYVDPRMHPHLSHETDAVGDSKAYHSLERSIERLRPASRERTTRYLYLSICVDTERHEDRLTSSSGSPFLPVLLLQRTTGWVQSDQKQLNV
jgi:hypothetical protein